MIGKMRKRNIPINNELLNLNYANCVEIAIAYCLRNINPFYEKYFLLCLKALQSYCGAEAENEVVLYPIEVEERLTEILELISIRITQYKNMPLNREFIDQALKNNQYVFLSVDSSELFYSDSYHDKPVRHVIVLCQKQDQERYVVIDNTHRIDNKNTYGFFYLPYELIEKMFTLYSQNFHMSFYGIVEESEFAFNKSNVWVLLHEIIRKSKVMGWESFFYDKMHANPYDGSQETSQYIERIIQLGNHKKLFYRLVSDISAENKMDVLESAQLKEQIVKTSQEYELAMQNIVLGYMKNCLPALTDKVQIFAQEENLNKIICSCIERWQI